MKDRKWDLRIERARELQATHPFAAEGLRFYERVAESQKSLYADFEFHVGAVRKARPPGLLRQEFDLIAVLPRFASFLSLIEQIAPKPLALVARTLCAAGSQKWSDALTQFWRSGWPAEADLDPFEEQIAWLYLQPYAEYLADYSQPNATTGTPSLCPLCSSNPQAGVLRQEGDGGKRSLICSLCSHEWQYRRLLCSACGEENVAKLVVYTAPNFPHVRVEACDTCRHYLKTIDLTKDGHAVPVVDELATIPLNLWAVEHGYSKMQINLLGL